MLPNYSCPFVKRYLKKNVSPVVKVMKGPTLKSWFWGAFWVWVVWGVGGGRPGAHADGAPHRPGISK